jgi:hypothetical protein
MNEDCVFTIDVHWTDQRPIVVDQHCSRVTVVAPTETEATIMACGMVMRSANPALGLREVQMPTRTTVVRVEI